MSATVAVPHTCEHCRKEIQPGKAYHFEGFLFDSVTCLNEWKLKKGIA